MVDMDATVWGPHYWFFLHTVTMTYPIKPNDSAKKKYYNLIQNLPLFIPNVSMAKSFQETLDMYPVSPYLDTRDSLTRWMHFIHNKINKRLGLQQISMTKFYEEYYDRYKPRNVKLVEYAKTKRQIIYALIVCGLFALIYTMYRD
jgi:FAD-linked sulfhydryl oxidase